MLASASACGHSPNAIVEILHQLAAPVLISIVVAALAWNGRARQQVLFKGALAAVPHIRGSDEESIERAPLVSPSAATFATSRCSWLDNCRFWLVACVIIGHAVAMPTSYMPASKFFLNPVLVWMATFHMPGIAFLSGICSRGPFTRNRAAKLFAFVFVPYVIFRFLKWGIACYQNGYCGLSASGLLRLAQCLSGFASAASNATATDAGVEWYLFSLIQWRLAAVVLTRLRPELMLSIAFGVGILSGYYVSAFSIWLNILDNPILFTIPQRSLSFFPFFALGLLVDPAGAHQAIVNCPRLRSTARALLFGTLLIGAVAVHLGHGRALAVLELGAIGDFNFDYVTPRLDPEKPGTYITPHACGLEHTLVGLCRAWRYLLSCVMTALVFAAVPVGSTWSSKAGRHTMYPYLLHQWLVQLQVLFLMSHPLWGMWAGGLYGKGGWLFWLFSASIALGFTYIATCSPVRRLFAPLIEPEFLIRWCTSKASNESEKAGVKDHAAR